MKKVRPYRIYGETQTDLIRMQAGQIVDAWLDNWTCARDAAMPSRIQLVRDPAARKEATCLRITGMEGEWCAIGLSNEFSSGFYRSMFNLRSPVPGGETFGVVNFVIQEALADLASRLMAGGGLVDTLVGRTESGALPEETYEPGSGCLTLRLQIASVETRVWLSRSVVDRYLKNAPARQVDARAAASDAATLVHPQQAIGRQRMTARIRLGDADLTLGELAVLAVGDVIKLDNRIADRAELVFQDTHTKCLGYLGKADGKYALRIESVVNGKS